MDERPQSRVRSPFGWNIEKKGRELSELPEKAENSSSQAIALALALSLALLAAWGHLAPVTAGKTPG